MAEVEVEWKPGRKEELEELGVELRAEAALPQPCSCGQRHLLK